MKQEVTPIDGFHYSTSEQFTGEYWIDGKKIYQKVVILTSLPASGQSAATLHDISNLNEVIRSDLRSKIPPNIYISLAFTGGQNGTACIRYVISDTAVTVISPTGGPDMNGWSGFAVIEYTKTTD